jgi:site-specific recombinase
MIIPRVLTPGPISEATVAVFPEGERRHRRVRELAIRLQALADAADQRARIEALVALGTWALEPDKRMPLPPTPAPIPPAWRRLEALVLALERPAVGASACAQVAAVVAASEGVRLFSETGLPNDRGLVNETTDRLFRRILPSPRDDSDLATILGRLFPKKHDLAALADMPPALFERLARALGTAAAEPRPAGAAGAAVPGAWNRLWAALVDAFVLVAARVQGLGLSQPIRERSRAARLAESPFYTLPRAADQIIAHLDDPAARRQDEERFHSAVEGCRQELKAVVAKLEATGISVDVVYALEVIEQALSRLEGLMALLVAAPGPARAAAAFHMLVVLVRARLHDRSLRALAYTNLHLLARKLVERAGRTGEHYITTTRREYWGMLASAAGGGLLTLGTAALKLQIATLALPLFVEGLAAGTNYALSFIFMQLCGFTLATKQPSMTAATLAEAIGEGSAGKDARERLQELVTQVARIARSQLCAAIGNVSTVTLAAVALETVYHWRKGYSFLDAPTGDYVLHSLNPLQSGTIWYAFLTGVILWASSLAGGWLENFAVYRRLPQAIAEHGLGRLFGGRFMRWLSEFFARNISGYGSSVALGLMLGMTPVLGKFFGLPLDVRHVTLSSGTLALALARDGMRVIDHPGALAAIAGIGVIFVLNLSVSFFLALTVALRAKEVPRRDRWALASAIARRFVQRPLEFVIPPRG